MPVDSKDDLKQLFRQQRAEILRLREINAALYGALKEAYKLPRPWIDGGVSWPEWDNAMTKIEQALAKAEGQPHA